MVNYCSKQCSTYMKCLEQILNAQTETCVFVPTKLRGCASGDEMTPNTSTALAPNEAYNNGRLYAGSSHSVSPERSRIPQNAPPLHTP